MRLAEVIEKIAPPNAAAEEEAQRRLDHLTKPPGSLGRLEEVARRVAAIQGIVPPSLGPKRIFVFAADHGVTAEGVSAYPQAVTAQMTYNFLAGGAAINALARCFGVHIEVIDAGVDHDFPPDKNLRRLNIRRGTENFTRGPAMTRAEAEASIEGGIRCVEEAAAKERPFLFGVGEMGIGNTTSAAAVLCALTGAAPREAAGGGAGVDAAGWERKVAAIEKGLALHRPDASDPLDILAKVGGLEIGAMTGAILGAAALRVPLVLDGFIAGSAALLARAFCPRVTDFLFAAHLSAEKGHRAMVRELGVAPLLDLGMRLGEGTGACLAMGLIEAAVKLMREMATFDSAGIAGKVS
ncbi:MAG TPA: nicotinate-nucleotide--dimethylbenzimidazole phosphoribosyltransferase [Verrucomicrobiae bacterium]|nr:nicotinate-nucleotide--dimethylbenzimidazole phosphoribosyltransferase [Verrucomicrobiae bacterium]